MHGVLLAVVDLPAAHDCRTRAKPVVVRYHAVAWRAALGTKAVGLLEPAFCGLRSIGHPARAVAPPTGIIIALKVLVTATRATSAAVTSVGRFPLLAVLVDVADEHPAAYAGVGA